MSQDQYNSKLREDFILVDSEEAEATIRRYLVSERRDNPQNKSRSFKDLDSWKQRNTDNRKKSPGSRVVPKKDGGYKHNLNLIPTPISLFPEDELIVYFNDKIYFLEKPLGNKSNSVTNTGGIVHIDSKIYTLSSSSCRNSHPTINVEGISYPLINAEFLLDLERNYLKENHDEIESFRRDYIRRLAKENSGIRERYDSLMKSLKENDSLESLVKNYFFPITKGIDLEKVISENKKNEKIGRNINIDKIRNIRFNHSVSYLHHLIPDRNKNMHLLITGGKLYCVSNELEFVEEISECEIKYKKFISEKIKEIIKGDVDSYFGNLSQDSEDLQNLKKKINIATSCPNKDFGTERISEREYVLFKNVGEYGVEWNENYYLFPSLKVGIGLTKTSSGYKIDEKAFVYKNPSYKHPYIMGTKGSERREICTAGRLNLIHSQIGFNSKSSEDKAYLMKSAKKLLGIFEGILREGHNSPHKPFDTIQESARLISGTEAEYYKRRGVVFFPKTDD